MTEVSVTISTAALVMNRTPRHLRRRVADGTLPTSSAPDSERISIPLDVVVREACIRIDPEDYELITGADAGDAESQCDLALLFLTQGPQTTAVELLEVAARQNYPEAMHWLGRCYIAGTGVVADERRGTEWIAKAANYGHVTAQHMVRYLYDPERPRLGPEQLEAALDQIERKLVLQVLHETADPK